MKKIGLKEARGRGMLLGLAFHPHENFSVTTAWQSLLAKGYLVGYYPAGNILRFSPSLTIEKDDITALLDCIDHLLKTVD